ncbi:septal ring lytic transglycosylase RlpA family protein [Hydrogenophaga sp.]|jgi:rare lipoprotein A|uniref:septal ring lytic transglycosylase RlpA family protein n=1 Tax=Hydrogenophaga sp. TaxID=1904254 RepID=UPI0027306E09|nr:septal ring lytic transglycosylase RlpA family protein [Hydrogenophaga sp.]MDP1683815.1 septal ring lytic transglycosylase RlpA family protein [Hydrogenophaga sp.]
MSLKSAFTLALATVLWLGGCATQLPSDPPVSTASEPAEGPAVGAPVESPAAQGPKTRDGMAEPQAGEIARGRASWYGARFHGRRTASGEIFNMHEHTAAHKTLPFGTRVRVRNPATGQEVAVRINDRGPHVRGRVIDLSRAAAEQIGLVQMGVAPIVLLHD